MPLLHVGLVFLDIFGGEGAEGFPPLAMSLSLFCDIFWLQLVGLFTIWQALVMVHLKWEDSAKGGNMCLIGVWLLLG